MGFSCSFSSLSAYLEGLSRFQPPATLGALRSLYPGGLTIVLGNQSADLDSIVSAIVYAWFLTAVALINGNTHAAVVPVVGIARAEWALRPEAQWLFGEHMRLAIDYLWFIDDINHLTDCDAKHTADTYVSSTQSGLQIVLVDHNRLSHSTSQLFNSSSIVEILDHHVDEGLYRDSVVPEKRRILPVGSCASLVAEKIIAFDQTQPEGQRLFETPCSYQFRKLLLAPILIDTSNLLAAGQNTSDFDYTVAKVLSEDLHSRSSLDEFFNKLFFTKYDISHLSNLDLLRRDYKHWTMDFGLEIGISAVGMSLVDFGSPHRGNFLSDLFHYKDEQRLTLLIVLSLYQDSLGETHREILLLHDGPLLQQTADYLLNQTDLNLIPLTGLPSGSSYLAFSQLNTKASRKQVQPALAKFSSTLWNSL